MKLYIQSSRSQMLFAKFSFRYMIIKDTKLSIVFSVLFLCLWSNWLLKDFYEIKSGHSRTDLCVQAMSHILFLFLS